MEVIEIQNINLAFLINIFKDVKPVNINAKKYLPLHCGFDIETTRCKENEEYSFMYIWQFSINNYCIIGRTWEDFQAFLHVLKLFTETFGKNTFIIVFVCNLGFEWQFMKHYIKPTYYLFKNPRTPIFVIHDNFLRFAECISWGRSLSGIAKIYTTKQKLKEDAIDYNKYRDENTKLTAEELQYCVNDVEILTEFSKYYFTNYIANGFLPITMQSVLRTEIKKLKTLTKSVRINLYELLFYDEQKYLTVMNYLFRGGFTHGNDLYLGKRFKNVLSYDITSSYPYVMLKEYYPHTRFMEVSPDKYFKDIEKFKFWYVELTVQITAKYGFGVESINKVITFYGEYEEINGRLINGTIRVMLTNLDWEIYKMYYDLKIIKIHNLFISFGEGKKLPRYIRDRVVDYYIKKADLKKQGKPYAVEKGFVNSFYGLMVTRMSLNEYVLNNDLTFSMKKNDIKRINKTAFSSPYWGIWVTAYARYRLLKAIHDLIKKDCTFLYADTDSIKCLANDKVSNYFKEENKKISAENDFLFLKMIKPEDYPLIKDIGTWDCEGVYDVFKFLGCKRYLYGYLYTKNNQYHTKVAGIPEKALVDYLAKHDDPVEAFKEDIEIKNCKNRHVYHDDAKVVDGKLIKSCISILPTDFTMSISENVGQLLQNNVIIKDICEYRNIFEKFRYIQNLKNGKKV